MSRDLILRTKACLYLDTSLVAVSEDEYRTFLINSIHYRYPNLDSNSVSGNQLYQYLTFQSDTFPDLAEPYEWWLNVPIGPTSCSRDIFDIRSALGYWFENNAIYISNVRFRVGSGDEWDDNLETGILQYQKYYSAFLLPTGYCDCETVRRLRMQE